MKFAVLSASEQCPIGTLSNRNTIASRFAMGNGRHFFVLYASMISYAHPIRSPPFTLTFNLTCNGSFRLNFISGTRWLNPSFSRGASHGAGGRRAPAPGRNLLLAQRKHRPINREGFLTQGVSGACDEGVLVENLA